MTALDDHRSTAAETIPPWHAGRVLTQSRWLRVVSVWCVGVGVLTMPLLGGDSAVGIVATLALWAALVTALATWSSHQQLLWRPLTATTVVPAVAWLVAYASAVAVGLHWWSGLTWAWVVADVATLAAPVAAALLTRWWPGRRAGSR